MGHAPGGCWRGGYRSRSTPGSASRRWKKRWPATTSRRSSTGDQGSQFTSTAFTAVLHGEKIAIGMDGKGCWRDNMFVERLWRPVKYEEVYLDAYAPVPEARAGIGRYIGFYNAVRPHSAPGGRTPDQGYFGQPPLAAA